MKAGTSLQIFNEAAGADAMQELCRFEATNYEKPEVKIQA